MRKIIIQQLKDFHRDRDIFNQPKSPFQSTVEIYENHAKKIVDEFKKNIIETIEIPFISKDNKKFCSCDDCSRIREETIDEIIERIEEKCKKDY